MVPSSAWPDVSCCFQTSPYLHMLDYSSYLKMLHWEQLELNHLQTDFESAAMRAAEEADADLRVWLFLFTQAIQRCAVQEGLSEEYQQNIHVQAHIRWAMANLLLPVNQVQDCHSHQDMWPAALNESPVSQDMDRFNDHERHLVGQWNPIPHQDMESGYGINTRTLGRKPTIILRGFTIIGKNKLGNHTPTSIISSQTLRTLKQLTEWRYFKLTMVLPTTLGPECITIWKETCETEGAPCHWKEDTTWVPWCCWPSIEV